MDLDAGRHEVHLKDVMLALAFICFEAGSGLFADHECKGHEAGCMGQQKCEQCNRHWLKLSTLGYMSKAKKNRR